MGIEKIRSVASASIASLPISQSFLISDSAGYINGEMVVQDGGSHLRSSGAEDLLQLERRTVGETAHRAPERLSNERTTGFPSTGLV